MDDIPIEKHPLQMLVHTQVPKKVRSQTDMSPKEYIDHYVGRRLSTPDALNFTLVVMEEHVGD